MVDGCVIHLAALWRNSHRIDTFDDLREIHCSHLDVDYLLSVVLLCGLNFEVLNVVNNATCKG